MSRHFRIELLHIQLQLFRVPLDNRPRQIREPAIDQIVHFPELALCLRGQRRLGAHLRLRMRIERKLLEYQPDSFGNCFNTFDVCFTTVEQYGHWKSENSTMVSFALSGPRTGSPAVEILIGSSNTGGGSSAIRLDPRG